MNKHGKYYEIDLFRGAAGMREMFTIGVSLDGTVNTVRYNGQSIYQWNELDAEAMAEQMCQESDPIWERGRDHFPSN